MLENAKQLNYDDRVINPSAYRFESFGCTIGNGAYVFTLGSSYIQFEIISGIINPSKISFQGLIQLVGANIAIAHASYFPYINRIEVTSSGGTSICNITNLDKMTKASGGLMFDYKKRSNVDGFLFPSSRLTLITTGSLTIPANPTPMFGDNYLTTDATGLVASQMLPTSIDEMAYYDVIIPPGALVPSGAGVTTYVRNHNITFSRFLTDTFFNIDEDHYFANSIIIKLYMSPLPKVGLNIATISSNTATLLTSAKYTNLSIQVAYQAQPLACQIAQYKSDLGYVVACPYVVSTGTTYSGNSLNSTFHLLGPALDPLQRIYKYYYLITLVDNIQLTTAAYVNSTNSSNMYVTPAAAGPPVVGLMTTPKLWTHLNVHAPNKGLIVVIDSTRNEEISLINALYDKTSFNTETSFKNCGVFAYTFDDAKTMKTYDGRTFVGDVIPGTAYDIQHKFTVPTTLTNNQLEHNIFAVFISPLYFKGGKCSWNSEILLT